MDTTSAQTIDRFLPIIAWFIVGFGGLWLVTSVIGAFQRRAYNLTHAESGSSKNIKPDFLKVDHAKREAALERGAKYEQVLDAREQPQVPIAPVSKWSQRLATAVAIIGLLVTIVGALQRARAIQSEIGSWQHFVQIVSENQLGVIISVIVIAASAYTTYFKIKSGKL